MSYRPISLLSPLAKIPKNLLLSLLQDSITLAEHQHRFREGRSTAAALQQITDHIRTGLNKNKPVDLTVMVAIDLSKAFNMVHHEIHLKDISELPLNSRIKRFLASYLRGRQTYVEMSKLCKMRQGVPPERSTFPGSLQFIHGQDAWSTTKHKTNYIC